MTPQTSNWCEETRRSHPTRLARTTFIVISDI